MYSNIQQVFNIFFSIFIEALPFILLGSIISGLLERVLTPKLVQRLIPKNKIGSILLGILLGFCFPSCECGIIPIVVTMIKKGIPYYVAIPFMVTAPIINPIVIFSTSVAFNNNIIVILSRIIGSIIVAIILGLLLAYTPFEFKLLKNKNDFSCCICTHHNNFFHILNHITNDFFNTLSYLVLGAFITSIIQVFIPTKYLYECQQSPTLSILIMMLLAFIMSLCSEADAFIASSLNGQFPSYAVIAFLIFGPMIDLKNLLMMKKNFSFKTTITFIVSLIIIIFIISYCIYLIGG